MCKFPALARRNQYVGDSDLRLDRRNLDYLMTIEPLLVCCERWWYTPGHNSTSRARRECFGCIVKPPLRRMDERTDACLSQSQKTCWKDGEHDWFPNTHTQCPKKQWKCHCLKSINAVIFRSQQLFGSVGPHSHKSWLKTLCLHCALGLPPHRFGCQNDSKQQFRLSGSCVNIFLLVMSSEVSHSCPTFVALTAWVSQAMALSHGLWFQ